MTPRCVNCIHWDEESAEENAEGRGWCNCDAESTVLVLSQLRTKGDETCALHEYKVATVGTSRPL